MKRKMQDLKDEEPSISPAPGNDSFSESGNHQTQDHDHGHGLGHDQNSAAANSESRLQEQLESLKHAGPPSPSAGPTPGRQDPDAHQEAQQNAPAHSHDFTNGASAHPQAPVASSHTDHEAHIHPDLRAQQALGPLPNMMPAGVEHPAASPTTPTAGSSTIVPPSDPQQPPPQPQTQTPAHQGLSMGDPMALDESPIDGRKAKRELSSSKRAAQNRAAQRAFRQRKEEYIKKLEQRVREFENMDQGFRSLQSENYALREYVIHLQSRLLDAQGEYPQPPPNVNLNQPPPPPPAQPPQSSALQESSAPPEPQGPEDAPEPQAPQPNPAESQTTQTAGGLPMEAVAQAVAGLAAHEQLAERQQYPGKEYHPEVSKDEPRDAEDPSRQLRQDGIQAPTASM